jgi:hypothetical protein
MKTSKYPNMIKKNLLTWIFVTVALGLSLQSKAQSVNKNMFVQMIQKDRTTIDAIAACDEKVQTHILRVAQTPELLNKIEELQKRSQNKFRAIIANYDQEIQGAFYEMARYPNLITELVNNGRPSSSQVSRIVLNYPDDIRETAIKYTPIYFDDLVRIDRLNSEIDMAFKDSLEPYDPQTRESVNVLIGNPEIVSVLTENKEFTSLLGQIYREDSEWIIRRLDRISQELSTQNKEDLDAYKNQIQSDPEAYNEMLAASEKFASDNNEARYLESSSDPLIDMRVVNSYPYWFGYPHWYSTPYWRPQPIWYHTGFYRNNYGDIVFTGLPSYQFVHWQTNYHPTLFPHLSYNYYSYYENRYTNRYRNLNRPLPHNGFYRSIEYNVINNPRVNNASLEQIDRQRGHSIVRKPNTMESRITGRENTGNTRQGEINNSRQGTGTSSYDSRRASESINRNSIKSPVTTRGSVNNTGTSRNNTNTSGGATNRREFNTVNPGRSEGPVNKTGTGSSNIRKMTTPVTTSPAATPVRTQQGTSTNDKNYERPQTNTSTNRQPAGTTSTGVTRQQPSSNNTGNSVNEQLRQQQQQRSATQQQQKQQEQRQQQQKPQQQKPQQQKPQQQQQQRRETSAPVQRTEKAVNETPAVSRSTREDNTPAPSRSSENETNRKTTGRQQ